MREQLRLEVFERDDYTCQYCGARPKLLTMLRAGRLHSTLHVDHMVPLSRGGHNTIKNLATACAGCNSAKRDRAWPFPLAYCASCGKVERDIEIWDLESMGYPVHTCAPCLLEINSLGYQPELDVDEIALEITAWDELAAEVDLGVA